MTVPHAAPEAIREAAPDAASDAASGLAARGPDSLLLVGAGKMGGAMLEGWLADGLPGARVTVLEPAPSDALAELAGAHGFALNPAPGRPPEVVVLATKPQGLDAAAPGLAPWIGPDTLLVSILAGKTIANLRARLPGARAIVRAMPNLPASIGRGATGAAASPEVTPGQRARADALLRASGIVEWVADEGLIDAVTALSGSGPAYVFLLAEAMGAAGRAAGLPDDLAARLARATVAGAGELLHRNPLPADALRRDVTSPGGTTAAALDVLMGGERMADLVREAVAAAKRRAEELSG